MNFYPNADFVVIDFETATSSRNSACSVGVAIVEGLEIIDSFYSLIQPPNNQYDQRNIAIHGITPHDTLHAEPSEVVLTELRPYIESKTPFIAHNISFDRTVLYQCLPQTLSSYSIPFIDTMKMVEPFNPAKRDLKTCCKLFGICTDGHHNALDDAFMCANLAISCIKESGFNSFTGYVQCTLNQNELPPKQLDSRLVTTCRSCGKQISIESSFCQYCGTPIDGTGTAEGQEFRLIIDRKSQVILLTPPIKVIIDDSTLLSVDNGKFAEVTVSPGMHTIELKASFQSKKLDINVKKDTVITIGFSRITGGITAEVTSLK